MTRARATLTSLGVALVFLFGCASASAGELVPGYKWIKTELTDDPFHYWIVENEATGFRSSALPRYARERWGSSEFAVEKFTSADHGTVSWAEFSGQEREGIEDAYYKVAGDTPPGGNPASGSGVYEVEQTELEVLEQDGPGYEDSVEQFGEAYEGDGGEAGAVLREDAGFSSESATEYADDELRGELGVFVESGLTDLPQGTEVQGLSDSALLEDLGPAELVSPEVGLGLSGALYLGEKLHELFTAPLDYSPGAVEGLDLCSTGPWAGAETTQRPCQYFPEREAAAADPAFHLAVGNSAPTAEGNTETHCEGTDDDDSGGWVGEQRVEQVPGTEGETEVSETGEGCTQPIPEGSDVVVEKVDGEWEDWGHSEANCTFPRMDALPEPFERSAVSGDECLGAHGLESDPIFEEEESGTESWTLPMRYVVAAGLLGFGGDLLAGVPHSELPFDHDSTPTRGDVGEALEGAFEHAPAPMEVDASPVESVPTGATVTVPRARSGEQSSEFDEELERDGLEPNPEEVSADDTDPEAAPGAVVGTTPTGGTEVGRGTEVTVDENPEDEPQGPELGGTIGPPTEPGVPTPDFAVVCETFPFGTPCWGYHELEALAATVEVPELSFGPWEFGDGLPVIPEQHWSFAPLEPIMERLRPYFDGFAVFLVLFGAYRWFTGRAGGNSAAMQEAYDEGLVDPSDIDDGTRLF